MNLSLFRVFTLFTILSILGLFVLPNLSVRLNPASKLNSILISYNWPNSSPSLIEKNVTSILESSFSVLEGVKHIESESSKGYGNIILKFDKYTDIDIARFKVSTAIRRIYKQLPQSLSYPSIKINRTRDDYSESFLNYSFSANRSSEFINEYIKKEIEPTILALSNVDNIKLYGINLDEYVLYYNIELLNKLGITKNNIFSILKRKFEKHSLGEVYFKKNYLKVKISSNKNDFDWRIPLKKIDNRIIFLTDIVKINQQQQKAKRYYRVNGKNSINLSIYSKENANTIKLAKKIKQILKEKSKNLPNGLKIQKSYDSTIYLETEINKINKRILLTLFLLLLFIFLTTKSYNYLVIIIISLASNLCICFLMYYLFEIEIHLYSLAGITISLGLMIDNSILMIHHLRSQKRIDVFISMLASTLTTIGALLSIYYLNDEFALSISEFSKVVIINLVVSLFISLLLVPALLKFFILNFKKTNRWNLISKKRVLKIYLSGIRFSLRIKKPLIILLILVFGLPIFILPNKIEEPSKWYEKSYNATFGNDWFSTNLRPKLEKYLGGTLRLFSFYVIDNASYDKNEETKLYMIASMENNVSIDELNKTFLEIENYLLQYPEIEKFTTIIRRANYGRIEIFFKKGISNTFFPITLKNRLINNAIKLDNINWNIYGVGDGYRNLLSKEEPSNFVVKAKGYNETILNSWIDSLEMALVNNPRVLNFTKGNLGKFSSIFPLNEYEFNIDKQIATIREISILTAIKKLQGKSLNLTENNFIKIDDKLVPVRLEDINAAKFDFWKIKNSRLSHLSKSYSLKDMIEIRKYETEESIYRENQEYIKLVKFQYSGAEKIGLKYLRKHLERIETKIPLGYKFDHLNNYNYSVKFKENIGLSTVFLAILIIYFICAILFESLTKPLIILSMIPISFIGVFFIFYYFDFNFDHGGAASFILLSGISVNSSIFILTSFYKLKNKFFKSNLIKVYLLAFRYNITPILLTIFSTTLAFIPFLIEGQNEVFWFTLGVGTIGGLIFSFIGIIFYLPIFALKKVN